MISGKIRKVLLSKKCSRKFLFTYSDILSNAFFSDPIYQNAIRNENKRNKILSALFKSIINYGLFFGKTYIVKGKGIALWLPPGEERISLARALKAGMYKTPFEVGIPALLRISQFSRISEKMHHEFASEPHWYLFLLAIDPEYQRIGLGKRLMQPILNLADQQNQICYLDTSNPLAVKFYLQHGFQIAAEAHTPISGISIWGLRREPSG